MRGTGVVVVVAGDVGGGARPVRLVGSRADAEIDLVSGGRLASLTVGGTPVLADVAVPDAARDWYRGCFALAPWAGALPGRGFTFEGRHHDPTPAGPRSAMHGLVSDVPWQVLGSPTPSTVQLLRAFGPGEPPAAAWPFRGHAVQTLTMSEDRLTMRLEVHSDEEAMPATAGFHPWFPDRVPGRGAASVSFAPGRRLVPGPDGEPWSPAPDLGERPWDDVFTEVATAPQVSWPGGPTLTLESDAAVWVYYERVPGGFCIEPWTAPPAALGTRAATVVTPGAPLELELALVWG